MLITKRVNVIKSKIIIENLVDEKKQTYFIIIKLYNNNLSDVYTTRKTLINNVIAKNKDDKVAKISKCLKYYKQLNIKNKIKAFEFFNYNFNDYVINFIDEIELSHNFIYSFFKNKFKVFKVYIDKHFANNFIKYLQLLVETFILFVRKKNDFFKLCVNYQDLNDFTIKNRYLLFFINENLNQFSDVKRFINLNLIAAYHRLKIKKNDE